MCANGRASGNGRPSGAAKVKISRAQVRAMTHRPARDHHLEHTARARRLMDADTDTEQRRPPLLCYACHSGSPTGNARRAGTGEALGRRRRGTPVRLRWPRGGRARRPRLASTGGGHKLHRGRLARARRGRFYRSAAAAAALTRRLAASSSGLCRIGSSSQSVAAATLAETGCCYLASPRRGQAVADDEPIVCAD